MKHKSLIAVAAALTLALSSMTALAADITVSTGDSGDQSISGDVNYVNTEVYKVTLPTTTGLKFTLDPQGLLSVSTGDYNAEEAGKIIGEGTMTAVNQSSVAIDLTSSFYLTDTDTEALTLVDLDGTIDDSTKSLKLVVDVSGSDDDLAVTSVSANDPSASTITMNAAEYEFAVSDGDYVYRLKAGADNKSVVDMTLTGAVAKDYDWNAYTGASAKTLTLNAVFKFAKSAEQASAAPVYSKTTGATITLDTTKNLVESVAWGIAEDTTPNLIDDSDFTFDKNTKVLTIANGYFGAAESGSTRYIKVTYGDLSTVVIAVTIAE